MTYDVRVLMANEMYVREFLCLKFSALISNLIKVNSYNPHKQKVFGGPRYFSRV